jgi:CBS domain containing-hemolysin-like protein
MNTSDIIFSFISMAMFVALQGFFSMQEMVLISKEKVRLSSNSKKNRVSKWSLDLLSQPERLYITSLVLVNAALVMGSESSRNFYEALGLSQNIAPLTQVPIVILLAELPALFAARKYTHSLGSWGIPFIYIFSKLIQPAIFFIKKVVGITSNETAHDLHSDLKSVISDWALNAQGDKNMLQELLQRSASLKSIGLKSFVTYKKSVFVTYPDRKVSSVREMMLKNNINHVFIYAEDEITSYVSLSDLVTAHDCKAVSCYQLPLYHTRTSISVTEAFTKMIGHGINVMSVYEYNEMIGVVFLDTLKGCLLPKVMLSNNEKSRIVVDKKFSTNVTVGYLFLEYGIFKTQDKKLTLLQLIEKYAMHPLEEGESMLIDNIRINVLESNIIGAKVVELESLFF